MSEDEESVECEPYEGPTDGSGDERLGGPSPGQSTALDLAQDMIARRVTLQTAAGYKSKLKIIGHWFNHMIPERALTDSSGFPKLPLDSAITIAFFGSLVETRSSFHPVFGKPSKKLQANEGHLSAGYVSGFKSALFWLHAEQKQLFPVELDTELNRFSKGYRKEVASLKEKGEMTVFEGKQALAFGGYKMLARRFLCLVPETASFGNRRTPSGSAMAITWTMGVFAWTFLLFQWNLIARFDKYKVSLKYVFWNVRCTADL